MDLAVASIAALVCVILALFVLLKNTRNATNVYFAILIFCLGIYPAFNYLAVHASDSGQALLWAKFVLLSAIPAGPLFYFFVKTFPGKPFFFNKKIQAALLSWVILNVGLAFGGLIFKSVDIVNGAPAIQPGPAIGAFGLLQGISILAGSVALIRKYRRARGLLKMQLQYITFGIIISFGLTLLATLIIPLVLHNSSLIPLSPAFLLVAAVSIAYSILRHRMLGIRSVVARSVTYVLLLFVLAALYALGVYALSSLFFNSGNLSRAQFVANAILAIILAFTFQPLRRFFEHLTDRIFYRDRYDSQVVLNTIGKVLASELLLEKLLDKVLDSICHSLNVETGQFMIFEEHRIYKVAHFGPLPSRLMVAPTTLKLRQSMLVADELEGGERKQIMEEHNVRVSLMLRTRDEFVGFLFLGDKLSGDIYSSQDLKLLEILASELAVAITNAKAYEEISQFNVTLQQKVDEATARLRVANKNLKALDKTKDEFISMASHQLRTPLTTIKGYLSMMLEGDAGKVTPEQKEFLDYAFGGAERMVALISDLLNVSRLSAGRFVIDKAPCDLVAVAADEVRQLQSHADAKQLKLSFVPPKRKMPMMDIDEGKTRQVIMNFIDNAIYYTKTGGITVSVEFDKTSVSLRVTDTGIGVPKAARDKLFTKFFRADNAQVARPDGTGLGLFLAKRVVEDQNGTIIFESTEGKGSTFGFTLPLAAKATPIAPLKIGPKVMDVKRAVKV